MKNIAKRFNRILPLIFLPGCALFHQPGQEGLKTFSRAFLTDYNTAWQATLDSLKVFERPIQNRQGGIIQTAWADNTADKMFSDPFGGAETYIKSRYRFNLSVAPGAVAGRNSVKVSIQKEQMFQRDLLEGWKSFSSDGISENTILYRVGRNIANKMRLQRIEEQKVKEVLGEAEQERGPR